MRRFACFAGALLSTLNIQLSTLLAQGTAFTYQGRLADGTNAASGIYDLRFTIYDSASGGSPKAGPLTNAAVPVNNGLFTVTLDFGAGVFDGGARWLETGVRTNGGAAAYATLAPRQRLSPTPYAMHAANATQFDGHGTNVFAPASGSANYVAKSGDTMTGPLNLPADGLVAGGSQLVLNNGRVGIGTTSPTYQLDLGGGTTVDERIRVQRGSDDTSQYATLGWSGIFLHRDNVPLSGNQTTFGVTQTGSDGSRTPFFVDSTGNVGIGTTTPVSLLHAKSATSHSLLTIDSAAGFESGIELREAGDRKWEIYNFPFAGTDELNFYSYDGERSVLTLASSGYVGIGTTTPAGKLEVRAEGSEAQIILNSEGSGGSPVLYLQKQGVYKWGWIGEYPTAGKSVFYSHDGGGYMLTFQNNGNVGVGTDSPQAKLHVNGDLRTSVLTITGGADLAEPFLVSGGDIPKGAVLVIDAQHPGQLKQSERAYDKRVAGIVSGANGIQPGITLHQEGALEGTHHVALSGRVYALADAAHSAIEPGDLLTTSNTPGHAMKVTDDSRAHGAILGKAMTGLSEGRGLVLVLVSLQ